MKFDSRGILATVAGLALVGYLALRVWPETETAPAINPLAPVPPLSAPPRSEAVAVVTPAPTKVKTTAPVAGAVSHTSIRPEPNSRPRLTIKPGEPIPELFPHQAERDQLVKLASTYDPKNIPVIASSLRHEDATVRESARQALVQMGDAAAVPFLQEALKNTRDIEESKLIREIIEFLSLPRFADAVTSSAGTPAPNP